MYDFLERVLISEEEIKEKTKELGAQITKDYEGKNLLVVSILKGSVVFTADLIRCINLDFPIDFMAVSSYGNGAKSTGRVSIKKDLDRDVHGCEVLIVEDILDTGLTLSYLTDILKARGAKSVKICTMLNKPARREADICADYIGFDIENEFVIGYGLDYGEKYRNLPCVGILKPEVYEK